MQRIKVFLGIVWVFGMFAPVQSWAAERLPLGEPVRVNMTQSVCTGESLDVRADARWNDYALKIEFAGPGGQYVGGEAVSVGQSGKILLEVICPGPWLLLQLSPGRYDVSATLGRQTARSAAFVSKKGQGHIILRFLDEAPPLSTSMR